MITAVENAVNGREIIAAFERIHKSTPKDGPWVGEFKKRVLEEIQDSRVSDPDEARAIMGRIVGEYKKK